MMRFLKFISLLALVVLNACGSGSDDPALQPPPPEETNPPKETKLYFEKQTDANCALHSINNAFGGSFLSSENYDRYISLTVAQKTDGIAGYRFTAAQQQALREYYDPNIPGDRDTKRKELAQNFDMHQNANLPIDWKTFLDETGLFGNVKDVQYALGIINEAHNLGLDNLIGLKYLNDTVAQLPEDFVNAERLIVTTSVQGGHYYALRKFNGAWYILESTASAPTLLTGNHIDWARTQARANILVQYFTADGEARIKAKAEHINP